MKHESSASLVAYAQEMMPSKVFIRPAFKFCCIMCHKGDVDPGRDLEITEQNSAPHSVIEALGKVYDLPLPCDSKSCSSEITENNELHVTIQYNQESRLPCTDCLNAVLYGITAHGGSSSSEDTQKEDVI